MELFRILEDYRPQANVVVDPAENYVQSRGKSYLRMDGSTDREKRKELADEFRDNHGIPIFLLSTRAMGLGLNLTAGM